MGWVSAPRLVLLGSSWAPSYPQHWGYKVPLWHQCWESLLAVQGARAEHDWGAMKHCCKAWASTSASGQPGAPQQMSVTSWPADLLVVFVMAAPEPLSSDGHKCETENRDFRWAIFLSKICFSLILYQAWKQHLSRLLLTRIEVNKLLCLKNVHMFQTVSFCLKVLLKSVFTLTE